MRLARRRFLKGTAAAALAGALPAVLSRRAWANHPGPLIPDPAGVLDLPEGFSYRVLDRAGEPMSDGYLVPGAPDGMAVFEGLGGEWILMRNHELSGAGPGGALADGQAPPPEAYDPAQNGGVTRVVIDPVTLERVSSNLVLIGTQRNCAGGPSPWGWLSCEESTSGGHGYVFLCDPLAETVRAYDRVDVYGRFNHEAACVDPRSNIAYLTEDRYGGGLYRFLPDQRREPWVGRLQAMKALGIDGFDTAQGLAVGDTLEVEWVDILDPTPADDSVRLQAASAGALVVARGEGIWYFDRAVYFSATAGGPDGRGQIFRYVGEGGQGGGMLTLVAQATDPAVLNFPDNLTVAPWGDVFIAEDNGSDSHLRMLDQAGAVHDLGRTTLGELAGVCFSPDGRALFVNVQHAGLTLMVTGPFPELAVGVASDAGLEGGVQAPGDAGLGAAGGTSTASSAGAGGGLTDASTASGGAEPLDASASDGAIAVAGGGGSSSSGHGGDGAASPGPSGAGAPAARTDASQSGITGSASPQITGGCACDLPARPKGRSGAVGVALALTLLSRRATR